MKSVLIVTRMGYIEGVFTSFRALANSRGATRINIEGEYEPYTETELKDIAVNGQNLKHITIMEKIEEYAVFKYEDEFGKKINPSCTPGAITRQPFSEDGKSAYVLNSKFVPVAGWWPDKGDVLERQERTRVYRAIKELERKAIEPIREAYNRLSPSRRSMFIAQGIYLLTK